MSSVMDPVAVPQMPGATRPGPLNEKMWKLLLDRIRDGQCTPFLGPETCFGAVPSASQIAHEWADEYGYPLADGDNLPRVAQFLAHQVYEGDSDYVRDLLVKQFRKLPPPNLADPDDPHRVLASLDLQIYICTHYHDYMFSALKATRTKDPRRDWCRWRQEDEGESSVLGSGYSPTPANPLVYHLYGHVECPSSLVLTEDDYLDFLARTSTDENLIPSRIQATFRSTLLFLGYQITDLDFRVLLRKLVCNPHFNNMKRRHLAVQMVTVGDSATPAQIESAQSFLSQYCDHISVGAYWGTSRQFVAELRQRWEDYNALANAAG